MSILYRMSSYAKKVLGMANARPALRNITNNLDTSSLGLVETPWYYKKPKYSLEHMKTFLDKLKTPAEIRKEEQKRREEENKDHDIDDPDKIDDIDNPGQEQINLGKEAANLNKTRIEFGNGCFMSFEGATMDDNANDNFAASDGEQSLNSNSEEHIVKSTPVETNAPLNVAEDANSGKKKETKLKSQLLKQEKARTSWG